MIRPFDIRDVSVIQRLTARARPLACELVAVDGVNPLRDAIRSYLGGGRDHAVVLVERDADHDVEAFGVMYVLPNANGDSNGENGTAIHRRAALVLMAPHAQSDELAEAWMYLAQEFAVEAAQRGAHHIVAEAPEVGGEAEALQGAGFVPLIQQDVLKLANKPELGALPEVNGLREQTKDDEPLIKALHLRAAPKMTYQAEVSFDLLRATHRMDRGFVLMRGSELVAHVSVRQGKRGYGMHALFRPDAERDALPTLRLALAHLSSSRNWRPVYLTVRHYQSWMLPILDELGFVHMTSTMLMVRHTAVHVHHPVWSPVTAEAAAIKNTHSASIHLESRASPSDGEGAYHEDALSGAHDYARTANH
ncbi:MAG: hypothetical protein NZM18_10850 [Thermoflexales bacterium]|nr:hypothetical protein [Thermoflexales bacterium]MDW8350822.1 hypothetical protein [Anaerolineae bacterium]